MTTELQHHVPATVEDMLPPKQSSIITEAANFIRAHWPELQDDWRVLAGEKPSVHGAQDLDESALVFKAQQIAKANGFAFLGSIETNKFRRALRFAYKRNTGATTRILKQQYRQLQIEGRSGS